MRTKSPLVRILRNVLGAIGDPLRRMRHEGELRRGRITPEEQAHAANSWWGDDKRWYPAGYEPRKSNTVIPLIDGEKYFASVEAAMNGAERYIFISSWLMSPHFPLNHTDDVRAMEPSRLVNILAEAAKRGVMVRILIWSGARLLRQPTEKIAQEMIAQVKLRAPDADIVVLFDHAAKITHTIHEKTLSIDGRVGFVAGLDFTTLKGDRWDTTLHPLRRGQNWHDAGLRVEGEIALDVDDLFRRRFLATEARLKVTSTVLPTPLPALEIVNSQEAQLVMTMPGKLYPFESEGEFSILHFYLEAIRAAKRFIYIENQFLWSPHITDALKEAITRNSGADNRSAKPFRIVVVLPAHADAGKLDNDQHVENLRNFDDSEEIFHAFTLYTSGVTAGLSPFRAAPVYLHAKIMIVDDEWITVGSANLNDRGLIRDVELNVAVKNPETARNFRIALWAEHLRTPEADIAKLDPIDAIDSAWIAHAARNKALMAEGNKPLLSAIHRYETGHMPGTWLIEKIEDVVIEH